jgi:hypothetical protein
MRQIRKGTLKFDGFKTFAEFAFSQKIPLSGTASIDSFVRRLATDIRAATSDDKFVYGHRTHAMFSAMVASLGHVKLIKQEDGGSALHKWTTCKFPTTA